MLFQYQLHGGIRRLQPRFDQSKQFRTNTTMAASSAPTPWNHPPPSVDDVRWWDNIFLNLSCPLENEEMPKVHRQKYSGEPHHGETHAFLVPALELLFSRQDAPIFKKSPGDETLKTSSFLQQQTTHFHHVRRIRHNHIETFEDNNPIQHNNPIPSLRGYHHVSQHLPKHPDNRPPNQGTELLGRRSFVPKQQRPELSCLVRARSRHDQGHPPLHRPLPTNSHPPISAGTDKNQGGQGIEMSNPWDFYGCYSEIFCTTMTRDDKAAIKVDAARSHSRPPSCSATKFRPKSEPITRTATPTSILEVLNYKKDKVKNNPAVEEMEETFASIASRPPLPKAMKFTVTEAARAAATEELVVAISKHRADFQAMLTSPTVKRTPAQENRLRANNVALMTLATICIQQAGGMHITLERLYKTARQEERAARHHAKPRSYFEVDE
jgi:hypothetical protein